MEVKFSQLIQGSLEIRQKYHVLEKQMHKSKWTLEEDALAIYHGRSSCRSAHHVV
jgi:hypothetical protein